MNLSFSKIIIASAFTVLLASGCTKQTEDYNAIDPALNKTLMQLIQENSNLSMFAGYLQSTGYDKELNASKSYTVYAPANSYFSTVDPAILSNPAKLKLLIGNHIALQKHPASNSTEEKRIAMINGKYLNTKGKKIDDVNISTADVFASNGLLELVDAVIPARENSWEFMQTSQAPAKQAAYMQTLFGNVFDTTNAVVIGIDPNTGDNIYQPGTDSIYTNLFWNRVYDLEDESQQFTYFMLADAAWDQEVTKYKPFFETTSADSTTRISSWNVVKDFAVDTVYNPATIPDTIYSKSGTKLGIDRSAIVKTIKTSNGIVYIMSKLDVQPLHKFLPIIIEAENYDASSRDRRGNTYFRDRLNPVTGRDFTDVLVLGHGVALFNLQYEINEMPKIKYTAYWVALNDFQTASFKQRLGVGDPVSPLLPEITVDPLNYGEVMLGQFTNDRYWPTFSIYLTAANSTSNAVNPLVCDYIKLVPSL